MEILGIKFVPLTVSLEERLQTLAVAAWIFTAVFGGITGLLLSVYIIIYTKYRWIIGLYLLWIWLDSDVAERGGRQFRWCKTLTWWKYLRDYFPIKVVKVPGATLDPQRNYLVCSFPHGLFPAGIFNICSYEYSGFKDYFPYHKSYTCILKIQLVLPFTRELGLALGGITSSAKSIEYVLSIPGGGHVCVMSVGGATEAYYCKPGVYRINLKRRRGFVRLALRNGTPLVPVFSFGETDLYDQLEGPILRRFQDFFKKWTGIAPIVPIGRGLFQYSFGLIPRKCPITTVVGKPLDVPKIDNPTEDDIDEYHNKFVKKLTGLFDEQKYNYLVDPENTKLIID